MKIVLNGAERELRDGANIADAVAAVGARRGKGVAVAVGGEVVPRSAWETTTLRGGEHVEVLEARQGG